MKYDWDWISAAWETLPETLRKLEDGGSEIFNVVPIGDGNYVKIITRRSRRGEEKMCRQCKTRIYPGKECGFGSPADPFCHAEGE